MKLIKMKFRYTVAFLFLILAFQASSQTSQFDTTFADDGVFIDSTIVNLTYVFDSEEVPGVGLYLGGARNHSGSVLKLKIDGTIDSSFGINGFLTHMPVANGSYNRSVINAIRHLHNGALLIATTKYATTVDTVFLSLIDTSGILINQTLYDYQNSESAFDIFQQSNHRILVAGVTGNRMRFFAYDSSLNKDLSFGGVGYVASPTAQINWNGFDATIDNLGRPIMAMHLNGVVTISRFNYDGQPDSSFGGIGYVQLNPDLMVKVTSVTARPDNGIYVTGQAFNAGQNQKTLILLTDSGMIETNFGYGGVTSFVSNSERDAFLQQDGKLIVVSSPDFRVFRFNANGHFDSTFWNNGLLDTNLAASSYAYSGLMQADGKIVVAGVSGTTSTNAHKRTSIIRLITGINIGIRENALISSKVIFFPNPVSSQAQLQFDLLKQSTLDVFLIDMIGRQVKVVAKNQAFEAGENIIHLDGFQNLADGNYFIQMVYGSERVSIPIVKTSE